MILGIRHCFGSIESKSMDIARSYSEIETIRKKNDALNVKVRVMAATIYALQQEIMHHGLTEADRLHDVNVAAQTSARVQLMRENVERLANDVFTVSESKDDPTAVFWMSSFNALDEQNETNVKLARMYIEDNYNVSLVNSRLKTAVADVMTCSDPTALADLSLDDVATSASYKSLRRENEQLRAELERERGLNREATNRIRNLTDSLESDSIQEDRNELYALCLYIEECMKDGSGKLAHMNAGVVSAIKNWGSKGTKTRKFNLFAIDYPCSNRPLFKYDV